MHALTDVHPLTEDVVKRLDLLRQGLPLLPCGHHGARAVVAVCLFAVFCLEFIMVIILFYISIVFAVVEIASQPSVESQL